MNVLFWNTFRTRNKGNIDNCIMDLVSEKGCDIIILAEYLEPIVNLCNMVNTDSELEYKPIPNYSGCDKIKGIINAKYAIESIQEQARYQIVKIETMAYKLLIGMIHNVSAFHNSKETQAVILEQFSCDINEAEKSQSIKNTMVIGDLNVNPFEPACIAANTLHAIPFAEEVEKTTRIVVGKEYQKFYNPTWKLLGRKEIPYATYYYSNSDAVNYYWHMFDQVIIRPRLIPAFFEESLSIIIETENHKLLKGGKPDMESYSDHLPLFYEMKEERIP